MPPGEVELLPDGIILLPGGVIIVTAEVKLIIVGVVLIIARVKLIIVGVILHIAEVKLIIVGVILLPVKVKLLLVGVNLLPVKVKLLLKGVNLLPVKVKLLPDGVILLSRRLLEAVNGYPFFNQPPGQRDEVDKKWFRIYHNKSARINYSVFRSGVMTVLLKEVFDSVSNLPEALQDEIAKEILVDIRKKLKKFNDEKLSWEETYREMAAEKEDWNDFDIALMDGLQGEDFESQKI